VSELTASTQPPGAIEPGLPLGVEGGTTRLGGHGWILRRLALGVVTLLVISFVIFLATAVLPGDVASAVLGSRANPKSVELVREQLHLDDPLPAQYWTWLSGVVQGDFGQSFATKSSVGELVGPRAISTLLLMTITALIAVPISVALGTFAATRPRGIIDALVNGISVALAALPDFVLALGLVLVLSTTVVNLLPAVILVSPGFAVLSDPLGMVLPVLTLVLTMLPYLTRLVRASVLDALQSDYVTAARLRGAHPRVVLLRHALRNSLAPAVQATALSLGILLGGTVVVEFIFQYPGLGAGLAEAVNQRDVPVVQATCLIFAAGWIAFNLLADIVTVYITPRLRTR
jgi:peptide/nickel transport system permease protein